MHNVAFLIITLFHLVFPSQSLTASVDPTTLRFKLEGYRYYSGVGRPVDFSRALGFYLQAAQRGDVESQFIVGGMLYKGQGIDPDRRKGFKWLLKAAQQGKTSPESMYIIGAMFLRGEGVPQSYVEAKKWLEPAAEGGDIAALNDLAFIYYNGLTDDPDYAAALKLYERAALQGDSKAQANLGMMHASGTGTAVDTARGYAWYSIAASKGNTTAIINRNNLMIDMSWEDMNRAQAISVALYEQIEKMRLPREQQSGGVR